MTDVYRAYDDAGILLYVGMTDSLVRRFNNHGNGLRSEWASLCRAITVDVYPDRAAALAAEAHAIRVEHPVFNRAGRTRAISERLRAEYRPSGVELTDDLELFTRMRRLVLLADEDAEDGPPPGHERWRPLANGLPYEVSDQGRVRGVPRWIGGRYGPRRWPGRLLTPVRRGPYLVVDLCAGGQRMRAGVHVLVLETFAGLRPRDHVACHRNGDHRDNRLANLYWGTAEDNARDRVQHGRHFYAVRDADRWGHRLVAPNLTARSDRGRECLACARAQNGAVYAARTGRPFDVRAEADRHYAEIMSGTARGPLATRTHCPNGHEYIPANLTAAAARAGKRACLTCERARGRQRKAIAAGRPFDFRTAADAIFAELVQQRDLRAPADGEIRHAADRAPDERVELVG